MARARLTIDLDAIVANWRALDAMSGPHVTTCAVIKADAYGLGAAHVGPALQAAGVRHFFVALAEEGVLLRKLLGIGPTIFVLSGLLHGDEAPCKHHALVPCLNSREQIERLRTKMPGAPCAIQIDSGMNRLGLEPAEAKDLGHLIRGLSPRLLMSHLACADTPEAPQNAAQRDAFATLARDLPPMPLSLGATGGVLLGPRYHFDLIRPGIGLFGGRPFGKARPVVRLSLPVIQTRTVQAGEFVGYGATWHAPDTRRIATVAAGYADGLLRTAGHALGGPAALHAGKVRCPIVGRISMDLITADVTALASVPDHLDILGLEQGIDDLADAAGTIGYEILTSLGGRYERVYTGMPSAPGPA